MNPFLIIISFSLLIAHCALAEVNSEPYQIVKIKSVFSKLITRDKTDRVYSGQIKSEAGLKDFEKAYGIDIDNSKFDFEKQMLIFGITDNISSRAFQFLKQEKIRTFTIDYAETEIKYKLRTPDEGKKHSYIQVFVLRKTEGISHIQVKDLIRNKLSKVYDFALIAGCSQPGTPPAANVVKEEQLSAFLKHVKMKDYHDVVREGRTLLKEGFVIPDHKTRLKAFSLSNPEKGQVRYELMSFQDEQGGYGINLFLKEETGEIIKFDTFEYWR